MPNNSFKNKKKGTVLFKQAIIIEPSPFTFYGKAYRKFVEAKIGVVEGSPIGIAVASSILGSKEFIEDIRKKYLSGRKRDRNLPALTTLTRISPKDIAGKVRLEFRDEPVLEKKVAVYLSHRFSGVTLKEIGQVFDIGESAVSQASRRFEMVLTTDRRLRKRVEKLQKLICLSNV